MKRYFFYLLLFAGGWFFLTENALALNWAWGGSELSSDGVINGNETGVGWISLEGTSPNYKVTIPPINGNLSGYAWSENLGWISFNQADLAGCPIGTCSAIREGDRVKGWARVLSIKNAGSNAGGWQGFIQLYGTTGEGLKIESDGDLSGYGWNGENNTSGIVEGLGWIDFGASPPPIDTIECNVPLTLTYLFSETKKVGEKIYAYRLPTVGCGGYCYGEERSCLPTGEFDGTYTSDTCLVSRCVCGEVYNGKEVCTLNEGTSGLCDSGAVKSFQTLIDSWEWECSSSSDPTKTVICSADICKGNGNWIEVNAK